MKGIRTKSDIEAGIGYSNIIGGDGVFGNLIGAKWVGSWCPFWHVCLLCK